MVGCRQPDIQEGKTLEQAEKHTRQNISTTSFFFTISFSHKQRKKGEHNSPFYILAQIYILPKMDEHKPTYWISR